MNDQRFQFIEVGTEPENLSLQESNSFAQVPFEPIRLIPPDQHLSYFDLVALLPSQTVLRTLSKNLIQKYRSIPLVTYFNHLKLRLPSHFQSEFHASWLVDSPFTFWIAMCDPFHSHTLRLLHNATSYNICGIPLKTEAFERFIAEDYPKLCQVRK